MRKEGLPFPCDECKESFVSKGARNQHKKAKHRVKVHSFGDLKDMIENKPNIVQGGNRPSRAQRWFHTAKELPAGVIVAIALFLGLAGSLVALKVASSFDMLDRSTAGAVDQPRPVITTVVKPQQK